jgi:hypothetical protein
MIPMPSRAVVDVELPEADRTTSKGVPLGPVLCGQLARQLARVLDDPKYDRLTVAHKLDLSAGDNALEPAAHDKPEAPLCFSCRARPATGTSAYCQVCGPQAVRPGTDPPEPAGEAVGDFTAPKQYTARNYECPRCHQFFRYLAGFDAHPCMIAQIADPAAPSLRDRRRTTVITIVNAVTGHVDTIGVCELPCRNEVLHDLGIRGGHGWAYKPRGNVAVAVVWNQQAYDITWARRRMNADYCNMCGHEWQYYVPELIAANAQKAAATRAGPPTERQLANRAAFADRRHREAAERADKLSQELVST